MTLRVNWRQGRIAQDKLVRVHRCTTSQPQGCQFGPMVDFKDFQNETLAKRAMGLRGFSEYKRCKHCWDNTVRTV